MVPVDVVEGFAGICIDYSDIDSRLSHFVQYYKCIDWSNVSNELTNQFLKSCFLGDDLVISYFYAKMGKTLYKVNGLLEYIQQSTYGFDSDALHKNPEFQTNMGSYRFMYTNIVMFDLFLQKIQVCQEIREKKST
jgi:hypothetical protein